MLVGDFKPERFRPGGVGETPPLMLASEIRRIELAARTGTPRLLWVRAALLAAASSTQAVRNKVDL